MMASLDVRGRTGQFAAFKQARREKITRGSKIFRPSIRADAKAFARDFGVAVQLLSLGFRVKPVVSHAVYTRIASRLYMA